MGSVRPADSQHWAKLAYRGATPDAWSDVVDADS